MNYYLMYVQSAFVQPSFFVKRYTLVILNIGLRKSIFSLDTPIHRLEVIWKSAKLMSITAVLTKANVKFVSGR